jgi:hypothetical protein
MIAIRVVVLICFLISQISVDSFGQSMPCDSVYTMVDEAPMFKGGYENLAFFINNLDFGDCQLNKTIVLTWTVDRLGQMVDIDVPTLEGECKSSVIAQLAKYPVWSPARVMGMPVCFKITIKKSAK